MPAMAGIRRHYSLVTLLDRYQLPALYIVNEAAYLNAIGDQWRSFDGGDIIADRLLQIFEREKVDMIGVGMEVLLDFGTQIIVAEGQHAAIGMVNHDDGIGPDY